MTKLEPLLCATRSLNRQKSHLLEGRSLASLECLLILKTKTIDKKVKKTIEI